MDKQKILIVDDSELNRTLLSEILSDQYDIIEAEDGEKAVKILGENENEFFLVLLDIMMPKMDGFEVLDYINQHYWNDRVIVMMISSDNTYENISHAFSLGAIDYINRPFDYTIVNKRIENTMMLYARQHDLENTIKEEFIKQQKTNDLMISILSHIVEFRNGESGQHIQHVRKITALLLNTIIRKTDLYDLDSEKISLITTASAIHDVGKISIKEEILNKPGRLTNEEFEIMKTHTTIGAKMMRDLPIEHADSPLAKVAYEICCWHHERYDGRGYPDGLKGDEIPISAQVVSIADVYDALTSERCYKKAFSHREAMNMIYEGQCGTFNPLLLECLASIDHDLEHNLNNDENYHEENKKRTINAHNYNWLLYIDQLTKLHNHRYFNEFIKDSMHPDNLILLDVTNYGEISVKDGKSVGDEILRFVANNLMNHMRKTDNLIRYANDKFLAIFNNMDLEDETLRIRLKTIAKSFENAEISGHKLNINIVAVHGRQSLDEMFDKANQLLEKSRENGNNLLIENFD